MEPPSTTTFDDLPIETIHHIFSFLSARHLAQVCTLVERSWAEAINDASLWRVLATRDFHLRVNPHASLASHSRQLAWKDEYRALLERWWVIKKLQLDANNIEVTVVRLAPAREADDAAQVLGAEERHTHHQEPVGMMEVEGEEDLPDRDDRAHRDKKRKREHDDGAAEAEAEAEEGEEVAEAGGEEGPALLLLHAAYLGARIGADGGEGDNVGGVQSTQPLTPYPIGNGRVGYFEVRIDSIGTSGNIGVGLCKKDYPKRKAQPGWRQSSYGWHGDDGRLYSPTIPIGRAWAGCPIWGPGDIVGCGIDYHTHDIFFTLNGQYLGVAFKEVQAAGSLYPTVGMNCQGAAVTFNLGGEPSRKFAYDLSSYPHIGPGFIGCLTPPVVDEPDADEDEESEEGDLKREIKAMEMMLSLLAKREEVPPAELKSDMESIAYMMGFKKALAKSKLDLQEKCQYLERKCKEALVASKFQLMMILRYRRREQGEPEDINQLFNEVNLDLGDVDYGDDGDEYDPDEEDVVEIELSTDEDDDAEMEGGENEGEEGDGGGGDAAGGPEQPGPNE